MAQYLVNDTAAGTALTNSTAETNLAAYTFPANFFQFGNVIRVRFQSRTTAQNSTDTLTIKGYLGSTAFVTTGAVDEAVSDGCMIEALITCRGAPSTATSIVIGCVANDPDATKQATYNAFINPTTFDTTGALILKFTGTWSVASASNSVQSEVFTVCVEV